jgi:hypothetical protein
MAKIKVGITSRTWAIMSGEIIEVDAECAKCGERIEAVVRLLRCQDTGRIAGYEVVNIDECCQECGEGIDVSESIEAILSEREK